MGAIIYFLLTALVFEKEISSLILDENRCSPFEYEYKILERIIFLENKNNELEKKQMVLERKNDELVEIVKEQRLEMERKDKELAENIMTADSKFETKMEILNATQTSEMQQVKSEIQKINKEQNTSRVALETDLNKKIDDQNVALKQLGIDMVETDNDQTEARKLLKFELEDENRRLETAIEGLGANLTAKIEQTKTELGAAENIRIGFSASLTGVVYNTSPMTVVFNKVMTNVGDTYNAATGIFKAPVNGMYLFSATFMTYKRRTQLDILKNNDTVGKIHAHGYRGGAQYDQSTNTLIIELQNDDEVYVKLIFSSGSGGYAVAGDEYSSFSGVLVE